MSSNVNTLYDVCVVGAGVIGSATARHLAMLGQKTLLLDQFPLPHWRGSSHGQTRIIRSSYDHPQYVKMSKDAQEMWKDIEKLTGEKILYENVGLLTVEESGPSKNIELEKQLLQDNGIEFDVLSPKQLKEKYPELRYGSGYSGILEKPAGILMADKCLVNLRKQFVQFGGTIYDGNKVMSVLPDQSGVTIKTSKSIFRAKKVVLTAGAWTNKLLEPLGIQLSLRVCQAPVLYWKVTKPGAYSVDSGFPCCYDTSESDLHCYCLPCFEYPDMIKLCVTGESTVKDYNLDTDAEKRDSTNQKRVQEIFVLLSDYVKEHFPYLDHRHPAIIEKCIYTITPGRHFVVDKHPLHDNVIFGAGFSGHGFKHAPVVGKILSELALGQPPSYDISLFKIPRALEGNPKSSL